VPANAVVPARKFFPGEMYSISGKMFERFYMLELF
jgi:hypothetical protein